MFCLLNLEILNSMLNVSNIILEKQRYCFVGLHSELWHKELLIITELKIILFFFVSIFTLFYKQNVCVILNLKDINR